MGKLQPHDGQKVGAYGWLVNKAVTLVGMFWHMDVAFLFQ